MKPMDIAPANAKIIDNQTGQSQYTVGTAIMIPAKPIMEPIERSNSPAIIRRQAPIAINPSWAETVLQFKIPSGANIPVPPAVRPKKTKTRTAPEMAPSSGLFSCLLRKDTSLRRSSELAWEPFSVSRGSAITEVMSRGEKNKGSGKDPLR